MRLIEWITLKTLKLMLFIISSSFVDNGGVNKSKKQMQTMRIIITVVVILSLRYTARFIITQNIKE